MITPEEKRNYQAIAYNSAANVLKDTELDIPTDYPEECKTAFMAEWEAIIKKLEKKG